MTFGLEPPPPYRAPYPHGFPRYPPRNDTRAILSLVLGLFSVVTCGMTGIPAVALGMSARGAIQRSGGTLRGAGLATAGIVIGLAGTAVALMGAVAFAVGVFLRSHEGLAHRPLFAPSPGSTTAWTPLEPSVPSGPSTIGAIRVMNMDPDAKRSFHQQLADEYRRAASAHQAVVLMTSARWCSVCREFDAALSDARMQGALTNVDLVRVDVDDFDDELRAAGMLEQTLPWFYRIDSALHPIDAISAGEWDENVPENMAPVLKSFLAGTLRARRANFIALDDVREPVRVSVKIRHRHEPAPAMLEKVSGDEVLVTFDQPQRAVTPGQAAVFYDDDIVVGGAWIV